MAGPAETGNISLFPMPSSAMRLATAGDGGRVGFHPHHRIAPTKSMNALSGAGAASQAGAIEQVVLVASLACCTKQISRKITHEFVIAETNFIYYSLL